MVHGSSGKDEVTTARPLRWCGERVIHPARVELSGIYCGPCGRTCRRWGQSVRLPANPTIDIY